MFMATAAGSMMVGRLLSSIDRRKHRVRTDVLPIVFMHGFAGFDSFEIGHWRLFEYFNGVQRLLQHLGFQVYMPTVRPFAPAERRVGDWIRAIEAIRRETGTEKVHLVGHSQGGIDARMLVAPADGATDTSLGAIQGAGYEHVASLTTIASPHEGSPVADLIVREGNRAPEFANALGTLIDLLAMIWSAKTQDVELAVRALGTAYMTEEFNPVIREAPGVRYYTVAGRNAYAEEVNLLLRPFYKYLRDLSVGAGGGHNDGLVSTRSAHFVSRKADGRSHACEWQPLGADVFADHFAQIGIPFAMARRERYDHYALFAGLVQRLDPAYTARMTLLGDGQWARRLPKVGISPVASSSEAGG